MAKPKYIKQGDRKPYVRATLQTVDGNTATPYPLAGTTVRFIMRKSGTSVAAINSILTGNELVDEANGRVQYQWKAGDTEILGDYLVEFEVFSPTSGEKLTFWDLRTPHQIKAGKHPEPLIISIITDLD